VHTCIDTGDDSVLRQAVLETVSFRVCNAKWRYRLTENMLCAGTEGGKGSCDGDSGGPLVCKQGDKWLQYGVVSFGHDSTCGSPTYPSVFAHVVNLLPWIQQHTRSQYLNIHCMLSPELLRGQGETDLKANILRRLSFERFDTVSRDVVGIFHCSLLIQKWLFISFR